MWGLIEEALENVRVELFPQEIETCGLYQDKGLCYSIEETEILVLNVFSESYIRGFERFDEAN